MKKTLYYFLAVLMTIPFIACSEDEDDDGSIVTDIDGNVYHTVVIGSQTWMVENLKTTKYNDGTAIRCVVNGTSWFNLLDEGAYCNYGLDEDNVEAYGRLYNWYAVETGKLCPEGWHVPSIEEWNELTDYLGGLAEAGGKLKEEGTGHWASPNTEATNETGFTALPGGSCSFYMTFDSMGEVGIWWSSTLYTSSTINANNSSYAYARAMFHDGGRVNISSPGKRSGMSVRCIKD